MSTLAAFAAQSYLNEMLGMDKVGRAAANRPRTGRSPRTVLFSMVWSVQLA